ncbi:MAG: hypothetical protein IJG87_06005 [Ruminococcus sp.]|nr:hypothetical protein [Ruminococcus sp.]
MMIKELRIQKTGSTDLDISWTLSAGTQTAYELFLIQEGCVVDGIKKNSAVTKCSLHAALEPMKEYSLLLTVSVEARLSSARAGFRIDKGTRLFFSVLY